MVKLSRVYQHISKPQASQNRHYHNVVHGQHADRPAHDTFIFASFHGDGPPKTKQRAFLASGAHTHVLPFLGHTVHQMSDRHYTEVILPCAGLRAKLAGGPPCTRRESDPAVAGSSDAVPRDESCSVERQHGRLQPPARTRKKPQRTVLENLSSRVGRGRGGAQNERCSSISTGMKWSPRQVTTLPSQCIRPCRNTTPCPQKE